MNDQMYWIKKEIEEARRRAELLSCAESDHREYLGHEQALAAVLALLDGNKQPIRQLR